MNYYSSLISKRYARHDALRSEILKKSKETSRSLLLKQLECDNKSRSMSQYEAVVDSLIARAETNETFIGKDFMNLYRYLGNILQYMCKKINDNMYSFF